MTTFEPNLSVLPEAQTEIWPALDKIEDCFTLYGGTAIALQLGHRISVDFDFFTNRQFHSDEILISLSAHFSILQILQAGQNLLTCKIETKSGGVLFSFFGNLALGYLEEPQFSASNQLKIASLPDLFVMKLKAILGRVEVKDFSDIAELLRANYSLENAIAGFEAIFPCLASPSILLRTLSFLEDERLVQLPSTDINTIKNAISDFDQLPEIYLKKASISS